MGHSFFCWTAIYVFHLGGISRFGGRRFVRIAESDAIEQLVAFGEFQSLEVFGSFGRVGDEACGACQATGTYSHRPGCQYHILTQQPAVNLGTVIGGVIADEHHSGRIAEHILEIGISRRLGVLLFEHFAHSVEKLRIVHYAYCPGLFVLSCGGIDASVQDDFHCVAIYCFRFVLADAAA